MTDKTEEWTSTDIAKLVTALRVWVAQSHSNWSGAPLLLLAAKALEEQANYVCADEYERVVADFARAVEQSHKLIAQGDILIADNKALRAQLAAVVDALEGLPGFDAVEQAKKRQAQLNATRTELDLSNRALDVQTRGLGAATRERDTALAQLAAISADRALHSWLNKKKP